MRLNESERTKYEGEDHSKQITLSSKFKKEQLHYTTDHLRGRHGRFQQPTVNQMAGSTNFFLKKIIFHQFTFTSSRKKSLKHLDHESESLNQNE